MEKGKSLKLTNVKYVNHKRGFKYLDFLISSKKTYLLLICCCGTMTFSFEKEKILFCISMIIYLFLCNNEIILNEK